MKYYWKLIRPINLILTVLTQVLFIISASRINHSALNLDYSNIRTRESLFTILACIFVAAGGYVINDIFDIETDRINKPEKLILSNHIDLKYARIFYIILTAIGIVSGFIAGIGMGILCSVLTVLLYFYSSDLKGEMLQGNLLISMMAGMVVYVSSRGVYNVSNTYFAEYASIAFFITMVREIIKDIEDIEGDKAQDYKTFPVVKGIPKSKNLSIFFLVITFLMILLITLMTSSMTLMIYMGVFIIPALIYVGVLILEAKQKSDFRKISNWLKTTMFLGLFSSLFC
jgi:4-hydroxybenzoate polyprenyltransferase